MLTKRTDLDPDESDREVVEAVLALLVDVDPVVLAVSLGAP